MTDHLLMAGLAEGIPSGTPPETIWRVLRYRRARELEDKRDTAQTFTRLAIVFGKGGTFMDVAEHLYPPEFRIEQERKVQEAEAMNQSVAILNRFRAIADKWDD